MSARSLGVVVTDAAYAEGAAALLSAAHRRGWTTRCFLTGGGVLALKEPSFAALLDEPLPDLSVCELSVERHHADALVAERGERIIVGGQYQNAELAHICDSVVVF